MVVKWKNDEVEEDILLVLVVRRYKAGHSRKKNTTQGTKSKNFINPVYFPD